MLKNKTSASTWASASKRCPSTALHRDWETSSVETQCMCLWPLGLRPLWLVDFVAAVA